MSTNIGPIEVLDTIQGSSYPVIERALAVLQSHGPDLNSTHITVVRRGDSDAVVFTGDAERAGAGENLGVRMDTERVLNPDELSALLSNLDRVDPVDELTGSSLLAIRAALDVFNQHGPDLSRYKIVVVRDGESKVVLFSDKDLQPGSRGSVQVPGFEVELNPHDLEVLRSNFVR